MKLTRLISSQATHAITTIGLLVTIANFASFVKLSALRKRSSFIQCQHNFETLEYLPTSTRFLFPFARIGHLMFNAISLKALAIFKPNAILIPVVMPLYHFFSVSPIAFFFCHIQVAKIYPPHRAAVINQRVAPPIRICLSCLPLWS